MNHQESSKGFLGFDFSSFFSKCGCVGRNENNKEESASSARSHSMERRAKLVDNLSCASVEDWTELDEEHGAHNVAHDQGPNLNGRNNYQDQNFENYETMEPIDFDYLKTIGIDGGEENKSIASGLSRNSKKISKVQADDASSHKKGSVKDSPSKGAKARGKRNPWQPHEDRQLLELVAKHGQSWSVLATMIDGRTGKQIRDRYLNILKPGAKKGDWTVQEDHLILSLYYQYGRKWSKISNYVQGRTEGQVKNRFYAHIQKKMLAIDINNNDEPEIQQPQFMQQPKQQNTSIFSTNPSHNSIQITPKAEVFGQQIYQQPAYPAQINDPTDLISYEDGKFHRTGSNEIFAENLSSTLPSPSVDTHTSNWNGSPSAHSYKANENEFDTVLDRVALYLEKGVSTMEIPSDPSKGYTINLDGNFTTEKFDRVEQLQRRKQALEMLLSRTQNQLAGFGSHEQNQFY